MKGSVYHHQSQSSFKKRGWRVIDDVNGVSEPIYGSDSATLDHLDVFDQNNGEHVFITAEMRLNDDF